MPIDEEWLMEVKRDLLEDGFEDEFVENVIHDIREGKTMDLTLMRNRNDREE